MLLRSVYLIVSHWFHFDRIEMNCNRNEFTSLFSYLHRSVYVCIFCLLLPLFVLLFFKLSIYLCHNLLFWWSAFECVCENESSLTSLSPYTINLSRCMYVLFYIHMYVCFIYFLYKQHLSIYLLCISPLYTSHLLCIFILSQYVQYKTTWNPNDCPSGRPCKR